MTITFLNEMRNSRGNEIYCFSPAKRKVILVFASLNSNSETADHPYYFEMKSANLSSPRAKRAGPKGLRAESARAVTGRRCPHSGVG